jgi:DNA-directed RNA polymerase II subunit RPB1
MIQMVNSGSKGGPQNITQMVATLGQQLIEGRRVQYTLQDRTLPHFARYDDGIESRGFVQNSFVSGLMPAEFFFHAQAGREGLIDTAVKTSDTGYIQRRLMKTMEDQHLEYDGSVRNVTGSIVQFIYGEDGVDTQSIEDVNIDLAGMSTEQIYREYALSPKDLTEFVSKSIDQTPDLVDELLVDRDMLVRNVFRWRKNDRVSSPVNIARMLTKYSNPYGTKTDLTPQTVVERLSAFIRKFPRNRVFHALMRYYLAPKKAIIVHRLTEAMFGELMAEIEFRYLKAQCHAGEMVGVLAAQSIGEPTTQLTLNTFHSAGTVKANATSGVPRIEELLSASSNPKRPGNTAYLLPGVDTKNEAIAKMKELQKTTLRDISKSVRIYYDPFPLASTTAVNEDREILELYERFTCPGESTTTSPWVMRVTLSAQEMVSRNTLDLPEIADKISNNFGWATVKCVTSNKEADKMILRIEFDPTVVKNPTVLRNLEDKILDIPLTDGPSGIGRVFLRTLKNEMVYDEGTASYAVKEQYVLDLEGKNLPALMVFPGIDMTRCFSNDIHEINEVFGIETARLALYEEFNEVFSTEKVNYHHLAVLVDTMTFSGRIVPVNRFGMKKNETGVLAKSSFEETSKVMFEAAVGAEYDSMRGVSANIMFGQKPPCGTGFVDILVDESRLPEGPDGIEEPDRDALDQANKTISETPAGDCRMEDILMAF